MHDTTTRISIALAAFVVAISVVSPATALAASPAELFADGTEGDTVTLGCIDGTVAVDDVRSDTTCAKGSAFTLVMTPGQTQLDLDVSDLGSLTVESASPLAVTGRVSLAHTLQIDSSRLDLDAQVSAGRVILDARHQVTVSSSIDAGQSIDIHAEFVGVTLLESAELVAADSIAVRGANVISGASLRSADISIGAAGVGETIVAGPIFAPGGTIRIDGAAVGLFGSESNVGPGADVDASADSGGGEVFIGGDPAGDAASLVVLDTGTVVRADAIVSGDGGVVRVWSDGATTAHGTISARGGRDRGNGGDVEVSGRATSDAAGDIDVSAPHGEDGAVLLDPLMFIMFPAGVGAPLTSIDDADAFLFKASPSPVVDSTLFVSQYFCDLAGLGFCGTPTTPGLDDYELRYWSTNTIIGLLTSKVTNPSKKLRDRLKPLKVRGLVTFLQPITLEQFQGDITLEAIFGVNLLHGVYDLDELGIPSEYIPHGWLPDGELRLDNQGPGEVVRASTPSSVVVIGDISTAGADIALEAGLGISTEEIADWLDQIADASGEFSQSELSSINVISMITAAFLDTSEEDIQTMAAELAEMVNLMCGGCVPDYNDELIAVIVPADGTRYDLSNITAIPPLLVALGVEVPPWIDDITDTLDDINEYLAWVPSGTDLIDAALGGIDIDVLGIPGASAIYCNAGLGIWDDDGNCWTLPPIPGIAGVVACLGVEDGGKCYSLVDFPTDDIRGWDSIIGCQPIDNGGDRCTLIEGNDGKEIGYSCAGTWIGGDCWFLEPFAGVPGTIENLCNLGTGVWQDGECWTIPPGLIEIPGLHDLDPSIPPTMAELISSVIAPLIAEGIWALVDEGSIAAGFGPAPTSLPIPSFASNDLPSLLYVSGNLEAPGGRIDLGNDSLGGLVTVADLISAGHVVIDASRSELHNARYDVGTVVALTGLDGSLVGTPAAGTLQGDEIDITVANGIGQAGAPITLRPAGTELELDINSDDGAIYLRLDRDAEATGSVRTDGSALISVGDAAVDLAATEFSTSGNPATFELDGSLVLPDATDASTVTVTGGAGDDELTTSLYAAGPVDVDGADGTDTLHLDLGGVAPPQDLYGALSVAGTAGITYANVEQISGLAPTTLDPVAQATVDEGSDWTVGLSWIDWGADSWTLAADWDDGTISTGAQTREPGESGLRVLQQDMNTVFTDDGDRMVTIGIVDQQDGIGAVSTLSVEVGNVAPTVSASEDQLAAEGDVVEVSATFADPGADDTHTATIDWGDGSITGATVAEAPASTEGSLSASHVYPDDGVHTVTVCVTDDDGGVGCDNIVITTTNETPVTEAGSDRQIDEGEVLSLDPATFSDPGTLDTHYASVNWGDGSLQSAVVTENPFGPPGSTDGLVGSAQATHAYDDNGNFTVKVCAADDENAIGCDSFDVSVANVLPVVGEHSTVTEEGTELALDAAISDAGVADLLVGKIDWGDGSEIDDARLVRAATPGSWTPTARHTYADDGDYAATLCVSDDDAAASEVCVSGPVTVTNQAPAFAGGLTSSAPGTPGIEGAATTTSVFFTDAGATDTHTAIVNWGDGSALEYGTAAVVYGERAIVLPTHVYVQDGTYSATVCVIDDDGADACTGTTFEIANSAPTGIAGPVSADEGSPAELWFKATDAGIEDLLVARVDWGDGVVENYGVPGTGGAQITPTHAYGTEGAYPIEVCVSDEHDAQSCAAVTADVANVAPVLSVSHPATGMEGEAFTTLLSVVDPGFADTHVVEVDWGDGSSESLGGPEAAPAHTYEQPGDYVIETCVTDSTEGVCQTSSFEAMNSPLVLSIGEVQPVNGGSGLSLAGLAVLDAGTAVAVTIDWGDGSPLQVLAAGETPHHQYDQAGSYSVEICADDDGFGSVCDTTTFVAADVPDPSTLGVARMVSDPTSYPFLLALAMIFVAAAVWFVRRRVL